MTDKLPSVPDAPAVSRRNSPSFEGHGLSGDPCILMAPSPVPSVPVDGGALRDYVRAFCEHVTGQGELRKFGPDEVMDGGDHLADWVGGCFKCLELFNAMEKAAAAPVDEPKAPSAPSERREYKHWPWCNGDRTKPAGDPGCSCCCFNSYAEKITTPRRIGYCTHRADEGPCEICASVAPSPAPSTDRAGDVREPYISEWLAVADAAIEALQNTHDWLGSAMTRNAVEESWARLERRLRTVGVLTNRRVPELRWRGSLLNALERAGFRASGEEDNWDDIRQLLPGQPNHEFAKGPTLKEIAEKAAKFDVLAAPPTDKSASAEPKQTVLCPSCQATDNNPYTDASGKKMRACGRCMIQWEELPGASAEDSKGGTR
jgi:hypothetical protein